MTGDYHFVIPTLYECRVTGEKHMMRSFYDRP